MDCSVVLAWMSASESHFIQSAINDQPERNVLTLYLSVDKGFVIRHFGKLSFVDRAQAMEALPRSSKAVWR